VLRYLAVHDCGTMLNPMIVEGQLYGGVVQGIGSVLLEHAAYGPDGQPLASTFMDYLVPTAADVPFIELVHFDGPVTDHFVNSRGVGESGIIASPAAVTGAIEDALRPFGVRIRDKHLPPARILELLGT